MPPFLFQSTISASHNSICIEKVMAQFPGVDPDTWRVCFIVPAARKDVNHKVADKKFVPTTKLIFEFPNFLGGKKKH